MKRCFGDTYSVFFTLLDRIAEAQLLATHSGNVIILTENLQRRLNSDGFAIKDADGQLICASDPSKAYNIRSIELDNDGRLFLTDAMNYLVWQLQLNDDTSEKICDLKAWKRLSGQQPPQKLTILHQSQTCISRYQRDHNNQKNSYEIMSQLAPLSTTNRYCSTLIAKQKCITKLCNTFQIFHSKRQI